MEPLELTILAKDVETLAYLFVLQIKLEINAPLGGRYPWNHGWGFALSSPQPFSNGWLPEVAFGFMS